MAQTIKLKRSATAGGAPTTSQIALGEVAINTYDGKMYIKKSVGGTESIVEISGGDSGTGIIDEFLYTATAGQTAFNGNDDNSDFLSYVIGAIQVFLNGVLLDPETDYTATNGALITLVSAALANDYIQIFSFKKKISDGNVTVDAFSGNNSTTGFTLSINPGDENNTRVFVDGVYQSKSNYSVSGTTLTFSTAPPSGTAIEVESGNRSVTLPTTENLDFPDNVKLRLGTSQDLQIYHTGTESWIQDAGSGNLYIDSNGAAIQLTSGGAAKSMINAIPNGGVTLFHNNSSKLNTNSGGVDVTGNIAVSGTVDGRDVASDGAAAVAALPKAGGAMTGAITTNSTFDGRDVATDGTKLDGIETSATADQTQSEINALGITATGLSGTPAISVANITTTGELRGPASLVIDPAGVGDNTGTVVIKGNLQVDGSQTTINSTTLTVDDLNLTLASGAANGNAANGAGLTIDGASATLTYASAGDNWAFNKNLAVSGAITSSGLLTLNDNYAMINAGTASNTTLEPVIWARSKIGASIVQMNVQGDEWQFGGGGTLDTTPILKLKYGNNAATFAGDVITSYGVQAGYFKLGSTVIVNSNRDLTNIGTISSGVLTINASGNAAKVIAGSTATVYGTIANNNGTLEYGTDTSGFSYIAATDAMRIYTSAGTLAATYTGANTALAGTISSGAITSTGKVQGNSLKAHVGTDDGSQLNLFANASGHCFIAGHTLRFNVGSNNARATKLYIDSVGNSVFSGTISSGAITSTGDFSTTGSITSTDGSTNFSISGDNSSNTYLTSNGEIRVRPSGTSVNKFVIGSNGNLTTAGTITAGTAAFNAGATNVVATFTSTDGYAGIKLADNGGNVELTAVGNDFHIQNAGAAAKMIVTSAGNVLVGTTSTDPNSTAGVQLAANGRVLATVDGSNAGYFNRLSSDGELVRFEKDGGTIGSIGVNSSRFTIEGPDNPVRITTGTSNIQINHDAHISFDTANAERMRVTSAGNIEIKQSGSAPTNNVRLPGYIEFKGQGWDSNSGSDDMNAKIEMAGTYGKVGSGATSPELVFSLQGAGGLDSSSEAYVEGMRLVGAGTYNGNQPRLGIGTDAPGHALHVKKPGSGDAGLMIETVSGGDPTLMFNSAQGNRSGIIKFHDNGTHIGRIQYAHNGDRLDFQAGSASGATMSILNGKVGIGTIAPTNTDYGSVIPKLHVKQADTSGAFNLVARFEAGQDANETGGAILINHSNDRGLLIEGGRDGSGSAADDDGVGHLGILTSGGNHTRMITLRQNMVGASNVYNVGIGTTTPAAKLEVAGGSTGLVISNLGNASAYDRVELQYSGYNSGTPVFKFRPTQTPGSGTVNSYFRFMNSNGTSASANNYANVTIDGKVGIGTNNPGYKLHVLGDNYALKIESSTGFAIMGSNNTSYFHFGGNRNNYFANRCEASGGFHTYSDERLKENIVAIPTALDKVAQMNGVTFNWKDAAKRGGNDTGKQFGVTAQNMATIDSELPSLGVDPLAVAGNEETDEKYYTMDYTRITPFLIEAVKELKTKLEAAEARIATLEG